MKNMPLLTGCIVGMVAFCAAFSSSLVIDRKAAADAVTTNSTPAPASAPATAPAVNDLQLDVKILPKTAQYHVGDTIEIVASLKNVGSKKMTVYKPDGDTFDPEDRGSIGIYLGVTTPPEAGNEPGKLSGQVSCATGWGLTSDTDPKFFFALEPGKSTTPIKHTVVLTVTGKMTVEVGYSNFTVVGPVTEVEKPLNAHPVFKEERISDLFNGSISTKREVIVSEEIPDAIKTEFDKARSLIDDKSLSDEKRIESLTIIAGEENVLAARFVLDVWKNAKQPAIKMTALRLWLQMLKKGLAYEGFPDAIKILADDKSPPDIRASILDIIAACAIFPDPQSPKIQFEVNQQSQFVAGPKLCKATLNAVTSAYESGEPDLTAKAKAILARMIKAN